jgi:hypothetical protein
MIKKNIKQLSDEVISWYNIGEGATDPKVILSNQSFNAGMLSVLQILTNLNELPQEEYNKLSKLLNGF